MLEVVLAIPFWFELAATLSGAISGAMSASRAQYDIFGTVVIAILLGLVGGVIRDVLLQNYGIYAFQKPELILGCVITAFVVFYFGRLVIYLNQIIDIIDTLSVAMWGIISVGKALSAGMTVVPAIILGMCSAVGGGICRDVIMNKPVAAFQPGSLYGSAALIGATTFALLKTNHILDQYSALLSVAIIVGIRYYSKIFGVTTKPSRDLTVPIAESVAESASAIKRSSYRRHQKREEAASTLPKRSFSEKTYNKKAKKGRRGK